jgi:hypothetical protein
MYCVRVQITLAFICQTVILLIDRARAVDRHEDTVEYPGQAQQSRDGQVAALGSTFVSP